MKNFPTDAALALLVMNGKVNGGGVTLLWVSTGASQGNQTT